MMHVLASLNCIIFHLHKNGSAGSLFLQTSHYFKDASKMHERGSFYKHMHRNF